jgi:transcriptional regulator GlxA family with amidase domain
MTGTNERNLQHTFKELYGTTLFDYAQSVRLDHARILLLDSSDSIQSIAEQCGYPDNSNLTAAFHKKFGYTPESLCLSKK